MCLTQSYQNALLWYTAAADHGHASAQYNLGVIYQHGKGVPKNDQMAFKWFQDAAEGGHSRAKVALQEFAKLGDVAQNKQEAPSEYILAAEKGSAKAQYNLGLIYQEGTHVAKNDTERPAGTCRMHIQAA